MARSDSDRTYSVGEVANVYGVTPATVRSWDGTSLKSFRTPGNQRRFKLSENPGLAALLSLPTHLAPAADTSPQKSAVGAASVSETT